MSIFAIPREAWRAMAMNRLRTGLTMLGMIIGVGAVVLMLAIGRGAQQTVNDSIATMGSNLFIILSGATTSGGLRMGLGSRPTLTMKDAQALSRVETLGGVAPVYFQTSQLVYGASNWSTQVNGVTPEYLQVRKWALQSGAVFDEQEIKSMASVAVVGQTVVKNLFGDDDPMGKTLRVKNRPFLVIGVLESKGQSLDGRDQDDMILVPISTARSKLFGDSFPGVVRYIMVEARSAEFMREAEKDIVLTLRNTHRIPDGGENDFTVRDLTAQAQAAALSAEAMSFMLGAIASISLIVGGIGIMNIMLVSVTERTREIGIRMAVGARRKDVLIQFLLEALLLCSIGGAMGAALGVLGAILVASIGKMVVVVSAGSILLSFSFSAAIGIFFGYYPARKASLLNPVEALRYE